MSVSIVGKAAKTDILRFHVVTPGAKLRSAKYCTDEAVERSW